MTIIKRFIQAALVAAFFLSSVQAQSPDYARHPSSSPCDFVDYPGPTSATQMGCDSFTATDFNFSGHILSIDYTNGQAADASHKGFLTSTDWSTFNGKISSITGGTCTNQFVTALSTAGAPTCTTDTLASAQHANQGTTTTVLHGNAAGNPSFASVALADLATQTDKTILANISGGAAVPSANTLTAILDNIFGSTRGMVLRRETSAWAAYGLGSSGQALVSDGTDAKWGNVGGGSGGGLTYVGSSSVTGSAVTSFSISGLDLNTDGRYFIWVTSKNAAGVQNALSLYFNSDTTATNYDSQTLFVGSTTLTGLRANNAGIGAMDASLGNVYQIWISNNVDGRPSATLLIARSGNTSISLQTGSMQWRTAGTNVTGITILGNQASGLAVGTKIEIWKMPTTDVLFVAPSPFLRDTPAANDRDYDRMEVA